MIMNQMACSIITEAEKWYEGNKGTKLNLFLHSHQRVIGLGFCGVGGLFLTMCGVFNGMQKNGMKIGF